MSHLISGVYLSFTENIASSMRPKSEISNSPLSRKPPRLYSSLKHGTGWRVQNSLPRPGGPFLLGPMGWAKKHGPPAANNQTPRSPTNHQVQAKTEINYKSYIYMQITVKNI